MNATGKEKASGYEVTVYIAFDEDDDNDNNIDLRDLFGVDPSSKTGFSISVSDKSFDPAGNHRGSL